MKQKLKRQTMMCFAIIMFLGTTSSECTLSDVNQSCINAPAFFLEKTQTPSRYCELTDLLQMINQVDASILERYIKTIQGFGPHQTGSDACNAVGEYLYETLRSLPLIVRYDSWKYKLRIGNNIEATLPGIDKENSIIVISAHYDSVSISPGADDDGSGVAALLATADILSQYQFNSTIRFVLFSGEEQGLLGSHEYVQNLTQNGEHILGDLNLDGVGYALTSDDGTKIHHITNNRSAWMVDISSTIASFYHEAIGLEVIRLPYISFGDHDSFVQNEYDASDFWEFSLTPYYHTSEDTFEHMNMTYLAKVCKLTVGTLATMAALHPQHTSQDIKISLKGSVLSSPAQFSIRIDNLKSNLDSANVTINIQMRNLWTNQYVILEMYPNTIICNWTFTKEISSVWEFSILGRHYSHQFISLIVVVKGIDDDFPLYTEQHTIGVIAGRFVFIIPK